MFSTFCLSLETLNLDLKSAVAILCENSPKETNYGTLTAFKSFVNRFFLVLGLLERI